MFDAKHVALNFFFSEVLLKQGNVFKDVSLPLKI